MPIREYVCCSCGHGFEELIRNAEEERELVCPECGSPRLNRCFSVFGVSGTEKKVKTASSSCSRCTSHNCSSCG